MFAACAHLFAVAMPIAEHAGDELAAEVLPRLASGEWVGANAITEAEAGSDVFSLSCRAVRDGDGTGYRLTGEKTFVTNVAEGWLCTVPDSELERAIDRLRELRMRGVLAGAPHVFRVRARDGPWRWLLISTIIGTEEQVAAARRSAAAAIGSFGLIASVGGDEVGDPAFASETLARLELPDHLAFREYVGASSDFAHARPRQLSVEFLRAYVGGPVQGELPPPSSTDLLDEGYGLYFLWSAAAATGREVRRLIETMLPVYERHGLPPLLEVTLVTTRGVVAVTRVGFDRSDPDSCARGEACYLELFDATVAAGFPPARCTTIAMDRLDRDGSPYWEVVRRLKRALDPDDIIAPGRYVPPPPS